MKFMAVFVVALALVGCEESEDAAPTFANPVTTNGSPQAKWAALGIESYDYEVQRSCFCTAEYTRAMAVRVRNGEVESAVYLDDNSQVSPKVLKSLRTVDQWLAYIKKGQDRPFARLHVEYHAEQGYPTRIEADVRERIADDEQQLVLKNLTPQ